MTMDIFNNMAWAVAHTDLGYLVCGDTVVRCKRTLYGGCAWVRV